mmetsp:Transcript_4362/g.8243  ORF Transcript_4362/g.8243 Transcript_4362/m.8243 type:complete len:90 (-) Transcript_4362:39-308(-)
MAWPTGEIAVRCKRKNQSVFLRVEASEKCQQVKQRLCEILQQTPDNVKLFRSDKETVLEDDVTIGGLNMKHDDIIYWVKRIDGSTFENP